MFSNTPKFLQGSPGHPQTIPKESKYPHVNGETPQGPSNSPRDPPKAPQTSSGTFLSVLNPPPGTPSPPSAATHAMGAAPAALGRAVELGVEADEVVGAGARVTQDDLPPLLAHLAVVLVVRLVAIPVLLLPRPCTESTACCHRQPRGWGGQRGGNGDSRR